MPQVVLVSSLGPQGPTGPQGPIGPTGSFNSVTGSFTTTASFNAFTSSYNTASFSGSFIGSVTVSSILTLTPQTPLPSGVPTGSFAVSSSAPPKPYFYNGTTWNALY